MRWINQRPEYGWENCLVKIIAIDQNNIVVEYLTTPCDRQDEIGRKNYVKHSDIGKYLIKTNDRPKYLEEISN